jgi:hypothetical protein
LENYKVNCNQDRVFIWGAPLKTNLDSPQATVWSLIDLGRNKIIAQKSEGFGIFDIQYLSDGKSAIVDYGRGQYTVSLVNGKIYEKDESNSSISNFEECGAPSNVQIKGNKR